MACWLGAAGCQAAPAAQPVVERTTLHDVSGLELSGSARDDAGRIWAVAERRRVLVRFGDRGGDGPTIVPIKGIAPGLELESLTFLVHDRFAVGTESDEPEDAQSVYVLRVTDTEARVVGRWRVPWSLWGLEPLPNQGIEGLCSAGPFVVVAVETAIATPAGRWGPIAVARQRGLALDRWRPHAVQLSSATGKLSALDCSLDDEEIEVLAIERHFGVARVLGFELDPGGAYELTPETVVDLAPHLARLPNAEGISADFRSLYIVTDGGAPGGTTERLILGPFDDD